VLLEHECGAQRRDAAEAHQRKGGFQDLARDTGSGGHGGAGLSPVVGGADPP